MPTLVKDEKGKYFVDTGGGVYNPVTEEQAKAFQGGQGMGENAFQSAGQGLENLITGAGSLLSDAPYWEQANQAGRAQSEALNLAQPVSGPAAQFAPQALAGVAAAPAGLLGVAGVEAALGAATTPETPIQGALIGGALGAAGELLPGAAGYLGRQGRDMAGKLPWFKRANPMEEIPLNPGAGPGPVSPLDEVPINPGGMAAGERAPLGAQGVPGAGAGPTAPVPGAPTQGPIPTPSPSANPPGAPPNPAPRMAERVTRSLDDVNYAPATGDVRVMEGTLSPETLYTHGIPTTEAQRSLLTARGEAQGAAARDALGREEASMSHPVYGQKARAIRDAQQQGATNYLTRQLDLPQGINITDPMLSDTFARIGGQMDDIATAMGTVPITQDIKNEFTDILGQTTGSHKGQLQQLADEIIAMSDLNGGVMTGDQWGQMRTKLGKMIDAGQGQGNLGKIHDASALLDTMTNAMESGLPSETRQELDRLRRQYAIVSALQKPGARNADGQVNPVSFYNNWKRPQSKKRQGTDDIGQFMNTIVTLTKKRTPDSGTAGRLLQNAAGLAADLIPGGNTIRRVTGL